MSGALALRLVIAAAALAAALAVGSAVAQRARAGYEPPRLADGRPDLQGIWQAANTAGYNLEHHAGDFGIRAGLGVVVDPADGKIPYQPAARAQREKNFAERAAADPLGKCYLAGVPRTMYLDDPLQIFQTADELVILSEYVHTFRWIPFAGPPRYEGYESWMGDSRGHWDGDTLVVETVGFNADTWLDRAGNFHSDALRVVERFTRTAANTLAYEATLEDPNVFTRPWTIRMPLQRNTERDRLLENECYLYAEDAGKPIVGQHPEP
jgi:hypothetical protein